ncbi:MAG: hypothetical protein IJC29_01000 [Clostridia bacterium]|nr:hypothetical protein [Clostridia bacterium]
MKLLTACLVALSLLCLSACGGGESLLSYQGEEATLSLSFERGGVPCTATLWLAEGGAERDFTLTYTAPDALAGLTVFREAGEVRCQYGGAAIPLEALPEGFSPVSLFSIPDAARVRSVESEGDDRVATLSHGDAVYTLRFRAGEARPYYVARTEDGVLTAVTVTEYK